MSKKYIPSVYNPNTGKSTQPYFIPPLNAQVGGSVLPIQKQMLRLSDKDKIPESFSWKGHNLIGKPMDQEVCGNCWLVSAVELLSDRASLKLKTKVDLSITHAMSCIDPDPYRVLYCCGGLSDMVLLFAQKKGMADISCADYSWCTNSECCAMDSDGKKPCPVDPKLTGCQNINKLIPKCTTCDPLYMFKDASKIAINQDNLESTYNEIKNEILTNGPVLTSYFTFFDFMYPEYWSKTDGIYINGAYDEELLKAFGGQEMFNKNCQHDVLDPKDPDKTIHIDNILPGTCIQGGHSVTIVGWGVSKGINIDGKVIDIPYWEAKNTWGPNWNADGYFKIAMYYPDNKFNEHTGFVYVPKEWSSYYRPGGVNFSQFSHKTSESSDNNNSDDSSKKFPIWLIILIVIIGILLVALVFYINIKAFRK